LPPAARWTARYTHDTNATSFFPGCLTRAEARRDSGQADACDYACDERKRVTRKTLTFAGLARSLTVRYEYDRLDRLTALTYPDGRRLEFAYDAVGGRMARVTERSTGRTLVSVTRDVAARPVALRNGALDVAWEYGSEGHLARQAGGSVGRTLFEERFEYDPDGRCSALVGPGGVRTDYERDLAARLSAARFSSEPGAPRVSYGYAAGGGLDSVGSALEDVAFSLSGSRVLEFLRRPLGRESLEYDAHGSVVRRVRLTGLDTLGVLELRYSGDHQLVAVVGRSGESSDSARYGYDACGWRVRRESTGRRTYQVRDEDGNLLAEVDSAGATVRDFVRVEGRVLGAFEAGGAYVAYLTDASGSVRLGVDDRGAVRFRQDFLPYGEPVRFEGEERPTLGFLGAEQDPETGYCYLKNRFYDPAMGRFLSPDPLRDSGASPYAYGLDDPLTFADPDGLAPDPVDQPVHVPRYWLAPVVVEATHGVPVHLLVSLRILRTVCGNDAERIAGQLYRDGVAVARAWRSMRDGLRTISGRKLARQAAAGLRRHLPAAPRILLRTTLTNPTVSHVLDRAMVMHELVAGLRVILALEKARGLTPQERDVIKLKAETVLLGETTADLVALAVVDLGMVDPPVGLAALITWGGMRGDVSDLSDSILARAVPGYAQTSVLDELFGPLLDDVPP
jgi:RHS repeat-associated protein